MESLILCQILKVASSGWCTVLLFHQKVAFMASISSEESFRPYYASPSKSFSYVHAHSGQNGCISMKTSSLSPYCEFLQEVNFKL